MQCENENNLKIRNENNLKKQATVLKTDSCVAVGY